MIRTTNQIKYSIITLPHLLSEINEVRKYKNSLFKNFVIHGILS